jgi:hypothetical protein
MIPSLVVAGVLSLYSLCVRGDARISWPDVIRASCYPNGMRRESVATMDFP